MKREIRFTNRDISEIMKGNHKYQKKKTFTADIATTEQFKEKNKHREIGEEWDELDENGNVICTWIQKKGYRVRAMRSDEIHSSWLEDVYPNCEPTCDKKGTDHYTNLDKKYKLIYGMCTDCAAKHETKLKTAGTWSEFERGKMLANAKSFFHEADDAVKEVIDRMKNPQYVNDDGSIEKWTGGVENAQQLTEEYNTYKELIIETLEGKNNETTVI